MLLAQGPQNPEATTEGRNQLMLFGGQNGCNLLYPTTKHVLKNFKVR